MIGIHLGLGKKVRKGVSYFQELLDRRALLRPGFLSFQCNICGRRCITGANKLDRESASCRGCGSTVRTRAVIELLSQGLFGASLALPDFPVRPDISGIGLSDWEGYAVPLSKKFSYTNTFFHKEPCLDITSIGPELEESQDFLISTEVFEHVAPPVSIAFANAWKLLKPDGLLVFSAPFSLYMSTIEHFPDLYRYELEPGRVWRLKNTTREGQEQVFDDLIFHGGPGTTLEVRLFSLGAILTELEQAGFQSIWIHSEPVFAHGIYWTEKFSLPITARK